MVDPQGFCEKHQLPLDRNGECELCRLSDMPSKMPPTPSTWWAVFIPLVIVLASISWLMYSFGFGAGEPEPPMPNREPPVPEPSSAGAQLEQPLPQPIMAHDAQIPEWKLNLARRRVTVTMYATPWCDVCKKAREYMTANHIEFIELDTDESTVASERLGELNPLKTVPTFVIDGLLYVGFRESVFQAKLDQAARMHL